ncbi:DHH family phosphoesterase [Candidatus Xianfuyuplasma coldseepsis]|uniref:Bifunctional oligoribonuclease/PAP phosphatase NrnA n=1 Tax=Candidatus Xianfuyuplasma coldseepsis TaxID=2782163 RepID=A0A7L7KQJ0_9MOLU|nr:bifunctional oligoribonuclease/PAP phosphatase NrnA [Xianfuyuplasma coldseepsis]QMS84983.1 bifunctional oligoribonuclease/PAP phosphatase NrnA [Xianfuyuplasma coldseepsis]
MDKAKLESIYKTIEEYNKIIIFAHKRPDGDAIGSSFGLKNIIETTWPNKEVHVTGESSDFTQIIGIPEVLEDDVFEGALAIALDTANKDRLADQRYTLCDKIIKMDHHVFVEAYGDIDYVDTGRPACTLMIMDLFELHKDTMKMTQEGAKALYFGTLTDTGRFKYDGVDGDTFRSVATLFDMGLDKKVIHQYLDQRSEELTRFKGYLLQHYQKTPHGVVYFKIKPKYLKKFKVTLEEASSLVNELGVFEGYPIWLLFAEYEEGIVRCRMRSKGPRIDLLANKYEGGGHQMASGASLGTWKRTDLLIKDADQLAKDYKQGLVE